MILRRLTLLSAITLMAFSACTRSASQNVDLLPTSTGATAGELAATAARIAHGTVAPPSPTPTRTPTATATRLKMTLTVRPSPRASATQALPSGTPAPDWQGIPIMPGALAGRDDGFQYEYSLEQEIIPVLDYYKTELPKLGWKFDKSGTGYQGEPLLTFKKGAKVLGVSVAILSLEDNLLLVTLAFP